MPTMHSRVRIDQESPQYDADVEPVDVEGDFPNLVAIYRAVDYSGAYGLENMLNKFVSEGWSIHKILPSSGITDFGIVVFEKWEEVVK